MKKLWEKCVSEVHVGCFLEFEFSRDFVSFEYLDLFGGLFGGLCFVAGQVQGAAM